MTDRTLYDDIYGKNGVIVRMQRLETRVEKTREKLFALRALVMKLGPDATMVDRAVVECLDALTLSDQDLGLD